MSIGSDPLFTPAPPPPPPPPPVTNAPTNQPQAEPGSGAVGSISATITVPKDNSALSLQDDPYADPGNFALPVPGGDPANFAQPVGDDGTVPFTVSEAAAKPGSPQADPQVDPKAVAQFQHDNQAKIAQQLQDQIKDANAVGNSQAAQRYQQQLAALNNGNVITEQAIADYAIANGMPDLPGSFATVAKGSVTITTAQMTQVASAYNSQHHATTQRPPGFVGPIATPPGTPDPSKAFDPVPTPAPNEAAANQQLDDATAQLQAAQAASAKADEQLERDRQTLKAGMTDAQWNEYERNFKACGAYTQLAAAEQHLADTLNRNANIYSNEVGRRDEHNGAADTSQKIMNAYALAAKCSNVDANVAALKFVKAESGQNAANGHPNVDQDFIANNIAAQAATSLLTNNLKNNPDDPGTAVKETESEIATYMETKEKASKAQSVLNKFTSTIETIRRDGHPPTNWDEFTREAEDGVGKQAGTALKVAALVLAPFYIQDQAQKGNYQKAVQATLGAGQEGLELGSKLAKLGEFAEETKSVSLAERLAPGLGAAAAFMAAGDNWKNHEFMSAVGNALIGVGSSIDIVAPEAVAGEVLEAVGTVVTVAGDLWTKHQEDQEDHERREGLLKQQGLDPEVFADPGQIANLRNNWGLSPQQIQSLRGQDLEFLLNGGNNQAQELNFVFTGPDGKVNGPAALAFLSSLGNIPEEDRNRIIDNTSQALANIKSDTGKDPSNMSTDELIQQLAAYNDPNNQQYRSRHEANDGSNEYLAFLRRQQGQTSPVT